MFFSTWIIAFTVTIGTGETLNCMYPRIEKDYDSEGFVCSWEEEDFYVTKTGEYILKEKNIQDNCIEKKARDRYWKKRNQKKVIHTIEEKNN
tara:strand:- start:790 stop:1065 length:276 start_codon:yes stop_codon:yes gene_type:complete